MKGILCAIVFLLAVNGLKAQVWFDMGFKLGGGTNFMFNSETFNDSRFNQKLTLGPTYGAKIGLNIGDKTNITIDALISPISQNYDFQVNNDDLTNNVSPGIYTGNKLTANYTTFLLMYRNYTNGTYFEIGPGYSILNGADLILAKNLTSTEFKASDDLKDYMEENLYSLVLGFGAYSVGTDNIGLALGLRFNFGLTDMINDRGHELRFPWGKSYTDNTGTIPLGIQAMAEFNIDFGFLSSKRCMRRAKWVKVG